MVTTPTATPAVLTWRVPSDQPLFAHAMRTIATTTYHRIPELRLPLYQTPDTTIYLRLPVTRRQTPALHRSLSTA